MRVAGNPGVRLVWAVLVAVLPLRGHRYRHALSEM